VTRRAELGAALALMRPRQWPVLTAQFAAGAVFALPAGPSAGEALGALAAGPLLGGWFAWVVLLNGGTLAFNSAWDRDREPVAFLPRPPVPPAWLATAALVVMAAGAGAGALAAGPRFGAVTAACVLLSVAYSHPRARWKGRPGLDLVTNMAGYGAGTTAAGLLAARAALPGSLPPPGAGAALACLGFACLFGSFYPLTQLYQTEADRARGDRTLSTRLGPARALDVALGLGLAALVALQAALIAGGRPSWRGLPAVALFLWLAHLAQWRLRAAELTAAGHERGMYRALVLWAVVDVALVAAWLLPPR
jgi:lycopene elongase/hydratase (dihydrobisanhydrobacterioruberin-forming)